MDLISQVLDLAPYQTVARVIRPNSVQSIRAYKPYDLMQAAEANKQHFLFVNLADVDTKQEVLQQIASQFYLKESNIIHYDQLLQGLTQHLIEVGQQPGFVVVLEQIPSTVRFDYEAREQLIDVFQDAADFWESKHTEFRVFYSFY